MKKQNTKKSPDKTSSKEVKLPKITQNNQKNKSPKLSRSPTERKVTNTTQNKKNTKSPNKSNSKNNVSSNKSANNSVNLKSNNIQVLTSTDGNKNDQKLQEYMERRKKRIQQEKKAELIDKKIYEEVLNEFKNKKQEEKDKLSAGKKNKNKTKSPSSAINDEINNIKLPKIRISEKKTQAILEEGGMLDAYKYLVVQLCKNGLPTGNLFEYSAYVIRNYEKKWKEKKSEKNKEKIEEYWKEKKKQAENWEKQRTLNSKSPKIEEVKINALNRSLEEREINKIIKNLDRSRSSRHHQDFGMFSKTKNEEISPIPDNKNKVTVEQKNGKNVGKSNEKTKAKNAKNDKNNKTANNNAKNNKSPKEVKKPNEKSPLQKTRSVSNNAKNNDNKKNTNLNAKKKK